MGTKGETLSLTLSPSKDCGSPPQGFLHIFLANDSSLLISPEVIQLKLLGEGGSRLKALTGTCHVLN